MNPPVEGMTARPFGDDYMTVIWVDCVMWAASHEACLRAFKERTGKDMESLNKRSGIAQMIDKATGYEKDLIISFLDWVTREVWGEESKEAV